MYCLGNSFMQNFATWQFICFKMRPRGEMCSSDVNMHKARAINTSQTDCYVEASGRNIALHNFISMQQFHNTIESFTVSSYHLRLFSFSLKENSSAHVNLSCP